MVNVVRIAYETKVNVAFVGRHGIGKTACIESLTNENFFIKTMILSQTDPLVLGGYPGREQIQVTDKNGSETRTEIITTFAQPSWQRDLWNAHAEGKKCVVFLDELNRADRYALNAAMRLVNEGEISGHKVPPGTIFLCAVNPTTETDNDMTDLNDPMMDRWCFVNVVSDSGNWLNWATESGLNKIMRDFIAVKEDRLNAFTKDSDVLFEKQFAMRILPTERSNTAVARILDYVQVRAGTDLTAKDVSDPAVAAMIQGLIGKTLFNELVTHIKDTYANPFKVSEMLKPTKPVMDKLKRLSENGQTQVIIVSLDAARKEIPALMKEKFKTKMPTKKDAEELAGFFKFFMNTPLDIQSAFMFNDAEKAWWNVFVAQKKNFGIPDETFACLDRQQRQI